ncbi:hypothetical protein [Trichocoleus sp. FACHB-262]|uniref:hypothetical protein n=1 Tax=Trichocoleus sp. FACHB-262 TaxID=2692869 RepID=UPI001682B79B|nr:hypothetical protein [Trichocoleus sp. FACHB-262]MBD2123149.1 hypothetical protein [Trichocoleus sp. FACHB-262]
MFHDLRCRQRQQSQDFRSISTDFGGAANRESKAATKEEEAERSRTIATDDYEAKQRQIEQEL